MVAQASALAATLGAGLIAGLCFTFGAFVMRALDRLGPAAAIRAMHSINAVILRSSAMTVWFGTLIAGLAAVALAEQRTLPLVATALYAFGALAITGRGNIPLNEALDAVDPDSPQAPEAWQRYRRRWQRWNAARTIACSLAAVGFALAA